MPKPAADTSWPRGVAGPVCGIDEVGRGPWAGPVLAAAVILRPEAPIIGLADSKALSAAARDRLHAEILTNAIVGIGAASVREIDRLNILNATMLAMQRAAARLPVQPVHALVDGNRPPALPMPVTCIVKGDATVPAIAAASIVAKVTRDRIMQALSRIHGHFGWDTNVGYGTAKHRAGLEQAGVTRHHRLSFKPVKAVAESSVTL
jgi:ribonuclease HII